MAKALTVSHSKIDAYLTCPKLFKHRYINKVYPIGRPLYFVAGSAFHKFLECFYRTGDADMARKMGLGVFDETKTGSFTPEMHMEFEEAKAMLQGICQAYPAFYSGDSAEYQKFHTELKLKGSEGLQVAETYDHKPIYYEGDIDGLAQDQAGDWWILEHKLLAAQTIGGKDTSNFQQRLHIDRQNLGYMWLAKEKVLGKWPKGVIYNVVKKPTIRQKKGETLSQYADRVKDKYDKCGLSEGYFQRFPLLISGKHIKDWMDETSYLASTIFTRIGAGCKVWPKATSACHNYGACAYLQPCTTGKYSRQRYEKAKEESPKDSSGEKKAVKKN